MPENVSKGHTTPTPTCILVGQPTSSTPVCIPVGQPSSSTSACTPVDQTQLPTPACAPAGQNASQLLMPQNDADKQRLNDDFTWVNWRRSDRLLSVLGFLQWFPLQEMECEAPLLDIFVMNAMTEIERGCPHFIPACNRGRYKRKARAGLFFYPDSLFVLVFTNTQNIRTSLMVHRAICLQSFRKVAKNCSFHQVPCFGHFFL